MKRKFIPAEESFTQWKKDPKYTAEYGALEEEFALASTLIEARENADMTQEEVAEAMGTTQAVVARLESPKILNIYCFRATAFSVGSCVVSQPPPTASTRCTLLVIC